ncbi:MAG: DNA helicase [Fimbriimonadales bacterium]|nr:MAG: DNA helicase [Fimbriimonadales bacterium]
MKHDGKTESMKYEVVYDRGRLDRALKRLPDHLRDSFMEVVRLLEEPVLPPKLHHERLQVNREWHSVRLDADSGYRVIFYEDGRYRVIAWVGAHDDAYRWAANNNPRYNEYGEFGTAFKQVPPPPSSTSVSQEQTVDPSRPPFYRYGVKDLVRLGVPSESWANRLKNCDAETLKSMLEQMREESIITEPAYVRLYLLSEGEDLNKLMPPAQLNLLAEEMIRESIRRGALWKPEDWRELENYLQHPWERWLVFLNPTQRDAATRSFSGAARVTGGPGTGKTVVAVHRAKALVERYPNQRILLTTFTKSLAQELQRRAQKLLSADAAMLHIENLDAFVSHQIQRHYPGVRLIYDEQELQQIVGFNTLCAQFAPHLTPRFVWEEWQQVIDAWGIQSEEAYLEFDRVGRGRALPPEERRKLWQVFERMQSLLRNGMYMTPNQACYALAAKFRTRPPFRCVIADEAQDFGPAQMHLLRSLSPADQPDNLFLCVDVAQRIYARSVPWVRYGIDVRGRSRRLRINYRNTREIQETAERVLTPEMQIQQAQALDDPEVLREAIAAGWRPVPVLYNPDNPPILKRCRNRAEETEKLIKWIRNCHKAGIRYNEIAVVARTKQMLDNIVKKMLSELGLTACECGAVATPEQIYADTAHAVKGLEFRAVAIVAADLFPLNAVVLAQGEDALQRERNLLFTTMTRPRERLYISWTGDFPEFLRDTNIGSE